ncbi:hypothetical protein ACPCIR_03050 [Mycobacterium sp. NPDC051198]
MICCIAISAVLAFFVVPLRIVRRALKGKPEAFAPNAIVTLNGSSLPH